ncbi:MAG: enoyl-CoA hydratase-related protein [Actinobacteria bacterium]|jgi:enoyl-CoA hydratase/carnithine racemase|nr:enoyl-CoA hydratase-related protein [Actinomycetota bacterium]MCL6095452.1 enoyl-CoA hydratase-related protein [Actinomycetota bacterium]
MADPTTYNRSDESVLFNFQDSVADICLNRPEKLNALDNRMMANLDAQLDAAEQMGARALLLRGAGRAFCAGRDLGGANPMEEDARAILAEQINPLVSRIASLPIPTFAAVHGACMGAGLGIAFACDVIYAADDAVIGSPFANIGAVLDSGGHYFLTQRIGPHRTLELVYTAKMLSGRQAADWGLVNKSVARTKLFDIVYQLALSAAKGPTAAFAYSKQILTNLSSGPVTLEHALELEAEAQGEASRTHDYREGITAFQEKRRPQFLGR